MWTVNRSPTAHTGSPVVSMSMPEESMSTWPRGSRSTAKPSLVPYWLPGQDTQTVADAAERLFREALPDGAEVEILRENSAPPGLFPPDSRVIQLGLDAFEQAVGRRPILVRSGGTLPIVPALAAKGIDTVVSGFALPESNVHSPNERLRMEDFDRSVAAAQGLYTTWAKLGR